MMNVPDEKTGASQGPVREQGEERADYSANPFPASRVPGEDAGLRLDLGLARLWPRHSRSRLQGWIREGRVRIDGEIVREPRRKLRGGESVALDEAPDERALSSRPEAIALNVVHRDEAIIVIDKPAGLVVHPGSGNWSGTLQNALLHHDPALEGIPRAGIVHRLDKDTSGLMVVARTLEAQTDLVRQLAARAVKRYYYALARGIVERGGTVDAPIGRHPTQRTKMAVAGKGKPARTHYRVIERFADCTLIECALETGRTHQIRVHLASIGHPLVGDPVYGGGAGRVPAGPPFSRQALHARRLGLIHPATGKPMSWKSEPPEDMAELIAAVRRQALEARAEEGEDSGRDRDGRRARADGPEIIRVRGDGGGWSGDGDGDDESE
ncbi:MAG: 23S rRNA pseudouridine(1911/1915/1917) synthase RluD [Candidatus Accumulibacter sp.]|jgi:23S rRNA pseudouridine1911/1915/1917 synthase|nr:23S rRNA pseudouridine(1911/1915/1917) synthase RluD [Accumulibacter sp.]